MKQIYEFNKGDEIVRVVPSKQFGDRSFLGEKMFFIGIANGMLYCNAFCNDKPSLGWTKLVSLPLDVWDDGWNFYIDPQTLTNEKFMVVNDDDIKRQLKIAIEKEDYALAHNLKNKLNKK